MPWRNWIDLQPIKARKHDTSVAIFVVFHHIKPAPVLDARLGLARPGPGLLEICLNGNEARNKT